MELLISILIVWSVITIVIVGFDFFISIGMISSAFEKEETTFHEFLKVGEFRVYHIIVLISFLPAWIIEGIFYFLWRGIKALLNIKVFSFEKKD